jgi:catechol 2,3-dioxygenase-like lactoylglutathione lyase family enzyme
MTHRLVFVDHITIKVRDLSASRTFYEQALRPLAVNVYEAYGGVCFGPVGAEDFALGQADGEPSGPMHIAFVAESRADVDAFHAAALAAGARDNGAPGLRPIYHAGYYGAFVFDPDGNNIEAVHHTRS